MENQFGEKSFDCNCPNCQSKDKDAIGIVENPREEYNSIGLRKHWIVINECNKCFLKFWHHATEESKDFYDLEVERTKKNRNKK
jgi:hypothetical protein